MIRPFDLVWLIRCHEWSGRVLWIECDQAMVLRPEDGMAEWMPLEFLELKPGQEEEFLA